MVNNQVAFPPLVGSLDWYCVWPDTSEGIQRMKVHIAHWSINYICYNCTHALHNRVRGISTHWGRDKMAAIFQTAFSNTFPWKWKCMNFEISLKFVPKGPINNIPAMVETMAWRRSGDKPLSEPMMVSLLAHKCFTRSQWVKNTAMWLVAK